MAIVTFKENKIGLWIRKKLLSPGAYDPFNIAGIYQLRTINGRKVNVREVFYTPTQTWSQAKQNAQDKFAAGVLAWQGLTDEQKEVYNERAERYRLPGYNLFLREYMKS